MNLTPQEIASLEVAEDADAIRAVLDVTDNAVRAAKAVGSERDEKNLTHLTHEEILAKMRDRNNIKLQCGDRVVLKDGRRGQLHYWTERGGSIHLDDPVTLNGYDYTHVDVDLTTTVVKE